MDAGERKALRNRFLQLVYEKTGGSQFGAGVSIFEVGGQLGLTRAESIEFGSYWKKQECMDMNLDGIARMMPDVSY